MVATNSIVVKIHFIISLFLVINNPVYLIVTYNHDSPKMNQITVEETGAGALKPELYYTLLHNKYKKTAAVKNKLTFRTAAGVALLVSAESMASASSTC